MNNYEWRWFKAGRMAQVKLENGEDIANLADLDKKHWLAISMPTTGVRFDLRMLQLMDKDGDGRIRTPEVVEAIEFLRDRNVDLNSLFKPSEDDEKKLAEVMTRQAELEKAEPGEDDRKALADWEAKGRDAAIAICGEATAEAEAALKAVEPVIDAFFQPPEDMPLVTEEPDKDLPLKDHLNPKHLEAILAFAEKCVKPVLGDKASLTRLEWKRVKGAFAAYRDWVGSKPGVNAGLKGELENEEREFRYKLHLLEFLENYVNMKRLYAEDDLAVFQTGTLRIDAKEMNLCFHVTDEGAHSALAEKSKCCIIYLKLSRPSEGATASMCAVVTAGTVGQLYAGRNGVFYDRDGKDWEAVITKVVESQVSLAEAFWAPWKKLGEAIGGMVKKFLGDREASVNGAMAAGKLPPAAAGNANGSGNNAGGAAIASSVAAIGIGIGMVGAALAGLMKAISGMAWWQILVAIVAVVFIVSFPSVILTWFKLRQRDLGAILNASGWAINRPMRFSMARARAFTVCARDPFLKITLIAALIAVLAVIGGIWAYRACNASEECGCDEAPEAAAEVVPAEVPAAPAYPVAE